MKPTRITIHCTDSPDGRAVSIEEIRRWHTAPKPEGRGWKDIGYHAVIDVDGTLSWGRPLNVEGAHVQDENEGNVGICLVGTRRYTPAQWDRLRRLLDDVSRTYEIRPWSIYLHSEFDTAKAQGKLCPNLDVHRFLAWYVGNYEEAIWPSILKSA